MSNLPPFESRLADRYLADECTPEERARVAELLGDRADGWQMVAGLHEAFTARASQRVPMVGEARERLGAHIAMLDGLPVVNTAAADNDDRFRGTPKWLQGAWRNGSVRDLGQGVLSRRWYALMGLAFAAVAIILGLGGSTARFLKHKPIPMLVYATGNGQRANITLSDGTAVSLNVASRLEVPADYLAGNHALRLNGEALFAVSHHENKPFTVIAGGTTTQVLGTSFAVRHYASDTVTTVAVRDGKVMVGAQVVPAMREVEARPAGLVRTGHADPARFSFASGVLTLNSVALSAAIVELNRWYDADIRLGDTTLATKRLTGDYVAGSAADLSNILGLTFNVRVVRDGRVLTLYAR